MTRTWVLALALLAGCGRDSLSPAQRDEVRAMIAADRAEQAQRAEAERQQMLEKHLSAAVDRAADENHLTPEQKETLLEVVRMNEQKVRAVGDRITDAAKNAKLSDMEAIYRDIEEWRRNELSARFGQGLGTRLDQDPLWIAALGPSLPAPH